MKKDFVKIIGGTVLTLMVILTLTCGLASAQSESVNENKDRFEGTWDVQVTIRNCRTRAAIRTFPSVTTFMSGGTMIDSTSGIPQALKTPGHGVWNRVAGNAYHFKFKSFNFDANGNSTGWTIITQRANLQYGIEVYDSAGTSEVYDPNGNLLFTGCSTTTATRFE